MAIISHLRPEKLFKCIAHKMILSALPLKYSFLYAIPFLRFLFLILCAPPFLRFIELTLLYPSTYFRFTLDS